jgi:hypothetical protein
MITSCGLLLGVVDTKKTQVGNKFHLPLLYWPPFHMIYFFTWNQPTECGTTKEILFSTQKAKMKNSMLNAAPGKITKLIMLGK